MDDRRATSTSADRSADQLVHGLRKKRKQFRELVNSQRDQLRSLEQTVERQIESISAELAASLAGQAQAVDTSEIEQQRLQLAAEAESLAELSNSLDARQNELAQFEKRLQEQEHSVVEQLATQQVELDERTAQIDAAQSELRLAQRAVAAAEDEAAADRGLVAQLRERLGEQLHAIEQERSELATLRSQTTTQRRHIAREFEQQRIRHKAELAEARAQLKHEQAQEESRHEARRAELERLSVDSNTELRKQLSQIQAERDTLRTEVSRLEKRQAAQVSADSSASEEVELLQAEIESLKSQLAAAESRPAAAATPEAETRKREDLQRRFEMVLEDLREQKRRNSQLEEQLAAGGAAPVEGNQKLDWESQKRRLLQTLEADTNADDNSRLSVEGTIRITDQIVARKDQEIQELKRLLEDQSSNLGDMAVGASAIAELFDQDELLKQQREGLKSLQDEWREKLRQAEVDISVERARMARERAELDEKLQTFKAERTRASDKDAESKLDPTKAAERRWWAKLGMKEQPPQH